MHLPGVQFSLVKAIVPHPVLLDPLVFTYWAYQVPMDLTLAALLTWGLKVLRLVPKYHIRGL